jgi:hypothetical protein
MNGRFKQAMYLYSSMRNHNNTRITVTIMYVNEAKYVRVLTF